MGDSSSLSWAFGHTYLHVPWADWLADWLCRCFLFFCWINLGKRMILYKSYLNDFLEELFFGHVFHNHSIFKCQDVSWGKGGLIFVTMGTDVVSNVPAV